jgi:hypothetical protein
MRARSPAYVGNATRGVETDDAEYVRRGNTGREHRSAVHAGGRLPEQPLKAAAEEQVVAENQRARLAADELLADDERLRETAGLRLHGVGEVHAPLGAYHTHTHTHSRGGG